MVKYLREREEDGCPRFSDIDIVKKEHCKYCRYRGTLWICKDGTITIACKYEEEKVK